MLGKSKSNKPSSPKGIRKQSKIKFNSAKYNLEHLLSKGPSSKIATRKSIKPTTTRTPYLEEKPISKVKQEKIEKVDKKLRLSNSPDFIQIVSNTIIKPIQQEGTSLQWKEDQSTHQKQDHKQDSSPDENPLFNPTWSFSVSSIGSQKKSFKSSSQTGLSNFSYSNPSTARNHCLSYATLYQDTSYDPSNYYTGSDKSCLSDYNVIQDEIINDPRTTIYIRHIPNKYSLTLIQSQIDKTHKNTYDFLHLPFDYDSNCNRGYAFINFLHKEDIAKFYRIYHGRRWSKFNSSKICEIKYACIQGKDALINHFHDTKVLNQKERKFRPIFRDTRQFERKQQTKR